MTIHREKISRRGGWTIYGHGGGGGKGGGASSAPTETRDSLHSISYAHLLMNMGVGEYEGFPTVDPLQSIFLDGTPIANSDGSINFPGVVVDYRSGTANQDPIEGFTATESTDSVGVEFRADTPWTMSVTDTELSAVRITLGVNGFQSVDTSTQKINGYLVNYAIDLSVDGGSFETVVSSSFDGKTTGTYERSHRIRLPQATTGWTVRVRRLTPDTESSTITDATFVNLISYIIDARFRWPMAVLLAIKVDASQFRAIPKVSADLLLRKIRVPSNYDPVNKIYTGTWDGTFQFAHSDCPPWVLYDVIVNNLFGVGDSITPAMVDRYAMYVIGQYCDELVPDGKGGMEPRYTCNSYVQTRVDAWRLIQDIAAIFRGMAFYASGSVLPVADMPKDAVFTYSNSNVIDGRFTYVSSSRKTRYTTVLASWNDMTDQGRAKIEAVEDRDGLLRYGLNQKELTLFGCTSQGQAQRSARSFLYTSLKEPGAVTFSVWLEALRAYPGQIIKIADRNRAGRRLGGRLSFQTFEFVTVSGEIVTVSGDAVTVEMEESITHSLRSVTIDSDAVISPGDQFTVTLPSGILETRTVAQAGSRIVEVTSDFSEIPEAGSQWLVESSELAAQQFRVVDVEEIDGIKFNISAVQHNPSKFAEIDSETNIQSPPITVIPPTVQVPPENVRWSSYPVIKQGISSETAVIEWDAAEGASYYNIQWKRDNSDWVSVNRVGTTRTEIENAYAGGYIARVQAINALQVSSIWANSSLTELTGIIGPPPTVTVLAASGIVFGINVSWGFPNAPSIIEKTEIWYSQTNNREDAIKLGDFSYPQNNTTLMGLSAGAQFFFWARLVDKNGTVGDWYPEVDGISGQALSGGDADTILSYLGGKITATQLASELLEEIESGGGASVELQALITELAAMYTIKTQLTVDGRTYVAGIGVGVENDEGIIESQVLVAADTFAVLDPDESGSATFPFVITGGQVFIADAVIQEASIGSAKLADWLESDALGPGGIPVLRLNFRTGEIELNAPVDGGGRLTLNNQLVQVFDDENNLLVRLGIWG